MVREFADKYLTPVFEPHVTFIGSVLGQEEDILSRTSRLAGLVEPLTIQLMRVQLGS